MQRLALVVLFFLLRIMANGQDGHVIKKDLTQDMLIYSSGEFAKMDESKKSYSTVYLQADHKQFKGDYLSVVAERPFSLFINNQLLIDNVKMITVPIDSLAGISSSPSLLFAIHQDQAIDLSKLTAYIMSKTIVTGRAENENIQSVRKGTSFRDFVVTAVLVMVIFLVSIVRLNPRLSSDYFSIGRIFSLRDYENEQVYRLTSGSILFYVFVSLMLGFYFVVIHHFIIASQSMESSYANTISLWFKTGGIILLMLFLKMGITYLVASLFGVTDVAGFHFFNFVRLVLIFMGLFTIVLTLYYILRGQAEGFYNFLYQTTLWVLGGWVVLLFLKLANRVRYTVFHIFSYICATEIIPFLLLVKVLND